MSCWGTGTPLREFLHVDDLAEAVAEATGYRGEIFWDASKPDGTPKKQLDVSRLAALGWRARIPLAEGLGEHGGRVPPAAQPIARAGLSRLFWG